jgi:ribonucleoside-diphosphate reductase alpha chain
VTLNKDAGNSDLSKPAAITAPEPEPAVIDGPPRANRNRLPVERASVTHKFSIANHEGYLTVGLYPNGQPGEIFLKMAKEGSTISGLMDAFATAVSLALQHGVPLKVLCDKFAHMRFEPSGWTGNQEIGYAKSLMDYIFRWITLRFVEGEQLSMFAGLQTPLAGLPKTTARITQEPPTITDQLDFGDAETCSICGGITYVSGTCRRCGTCGVSGGCS